jgi:hypothetical protein
MATIKITQAEFDDFMLEEDTTPYLSVSAAEQELNSGESILGQFTARARQLGYADRSEERPHWTERLIEELDGADEVDFREMDA